jgi:hypothetical protein
VLNKLTLLREVAYMSIDTLQLLAAQEAKAGWKSAKSKGEPIEQA